MSTQDRGGFGRDTADRTTYATSADGGTEVARYDRAGKWWLERADGTRAPLALQTAATEALVLEAQGGRIHTGRHGGSRFDNTVARRRTARSR